MYAKLITRQSGISSLKETEAAPLPCAPPASESGSAPSAYHRLPMSATGSSTTTAGR